ncbi:hypothetical protein IU462_31180 [Nocardia farcinica]|nr:hypothetical protein [Nocardia farcinica]
MRMLDGHEIGETIDLGAAAAAGWAREGIPIDTIQHAIHEGFKLSFDLIQSQASAHDYESLINVARRLMEILDALTLAV